MISLAFGVCIEIVHRLVPWMSLACKAFLAGEAEVVLGYSFEVKDVSLGLLADRRTTSRM